MSLYIRSGLPIGIPTISSYKALGKGSNSGLYLNQPALTATSYKPLKKVCQISTLRISKWNEVIGRHGRISIGLSFDAQANGSRTTPGGASFSTSGSVGNAFQFTTIGSPTEFGATSACLSVQNPIFQWFLVPKSPLGPQKIQFPVTNIQTAPSPGATYNDFGVVTAEQDTAGYCYIFHDAGKIYIGLALQIVIGYGTIAPHGGPYPDGFPYPRGGAVAAQIYTGNFGTWAGTELPTTGVLSDFSHVATSDENWTISPVDGGISLLGVPVKTRTYNYSEPYGFSGDVGDVNGGEFSLTLSDLSVEYESP